MYVRPIVEVSFVFLQTGTREIIPCSYISPFTTQNAGKALWGADSSLRTTMLWESCLDRTWGIPNDKCYVYQGHIDILVLLVGCPTDVWVSLLVGFGELKCVTGRSLVEPISSGSALSMGAGMAWDSIFLRKWWFLSVTLIPYCWSRRTVISWPVMFHQWLSWFCIATVLPFWRLPSFVGVLVS